MLCPRCETVMLDEVERGGVVLDLCKKCRGLWLDRGELEKLLAAARDDDRRPVSPRDDDRRPVSPRDDEDRRYARDDRPFDVEERFDSSRRERAYRDRDGKPRKKSRFLDVLGDIFD